MTETPRQKDLAESPIRRRAIRLPVWIGLGGFVALLALFLLIRSCGTLHLTEEQVQQTVISTLASEAPESFLVAGTLVFSSTVESRSEKTFLPGILDLNLGTTTATVRVPGRVSYGFDIRGLDASDIHYSEDGVVDVDLPALSVFSVEPQMEDVEIQTDVGWARLHRSSGQEMEQQALQAIRPTMRETAERHLAGSESPGLNAARAVALLLSPALEAAGVSEPRYRFRVGERGTLEFSSSELEVLENLDGDE